MSDMRATTANALWVAACVPEWRRFRRALDRVPAVQYRLLQLYLDANRESTYGRRYGFASLKSVRDYQEAVPLTTYDDYVEAIDAIGDGHAGVLTAEPVSMFEPSS